MILTDDHPPRAGGVAIWTARVASELVRRGHEVRVLARRREDLVELPGTRLTPVRGPSFGRYGGTWLGLRGIRALLGADAVLATTWPVATLATRLGAPVHVVAHGSDVTARRPDAGVWTRASGRWAVSRFLADRLADDGIEAQPLPAPVSVAPFPAAVGDGRRWGLVARAVPGKGGERFVRLVAAADVDGVVVGDGPELPSWRALADRIGARINFRGAVPAERVAEEVRGLDLVCLLPTAPEGLGLALVEAAALGVPVVGCRAGGVPEAVGPGLVLDDPDDARRSARQVRAWWSPDQGRRAWAWCRATHGVERTVDRLS